MSRAETEALERKACDWLVAQFRGNNDCTDDKCVHTVLDLLERVLAARGKLVVYPDVRNASTRLKVIGFCSDSLSHLGRAALVGCYALRGVIPEEEAWDVIREAEDLR
jgi:hypothetical protein